MAHGTAEPEATAPDTEAMRGSTRILLVEGADLPALDELDTLTAALRSHIQALIPEVAAAVAREPKDSIPRYCALACIGEARNKLRLNDGGTLAVRISTARKLARVVNALCDHHENLNQYPGAGR